MCGRYTLVASPDQIRQAFPSLNLTWDPPQRFNIAPSQEVLIAKNDGSNAMTTARWGLIPSWEKSPTGGRRPINARLEGLAESRMYGPLLRRHRCAVFGDGFFEWALEAGKKIPYYFRLKGGTPFAFAGLWAEREGASTCTIVTGPPNRLVATIHERMPIILPSGALAIWLQTGELSIAEATAMLHPYPEERMERRRVSTLVNNVRNDLPAILAAA